ncbi:MAG: gamma carbonic anhydrase family protein [Candidatus Omnitrophica bacterium]|nr:gamma carbonic anhydrase family protein [Candidatus Omnitrophota bacterium]
MRLPKEPFRPQVGKQVFIAKSAVVEGRVKLGDYSSVWPGAVLRADINRIEVGHYSNIQDLSVLHVESDRPCLVGEYVVVGHAAILHACRVMDGSLVGMGSIVLDGAQIGSGTLLGAGSLVPQGMRLKPGSLYFGRPARLIRKLSKKEIRGLIQWAKRYVRLRQEHLAGRFESYYNTHFQ